MIKSLNSHAIIAIVLVLSGNGCKPTPSEEAVSKPRPSLSTPVDIEPISTLLTGRVEELFLAGKSMVKFPPETNETLVESELPLRAIVLRFKRQNSSVVSVTAVGRTNVDLQLAEELSVGHTYIIPNDLVRLQSNITGKISLTNRIH